MNISGINSNFSSKGADNGKIQNLENQKRTIQQEIEKIKKDKNLDPKEAEAKEKALREKLKNIEQKIKEEKTNKSNEKQEKVDESSNKEDSSNENLKKIEELDKNGPQQIGVNEWLV